MPKLIIYCGGQPSFYAYKRREFMWDNDRKVYVYKNKVYSDLNEFHADVVKVLAGNTDLRPGVMVLPEVVASLAADELPPPEVATIAAEVTLDVALEVVQRLAPDRLKKKSGPKAAKAA